MPYKMEEPYNETSIKLHVGSEVRVVCPDKDKYPSFNASFHGHKGRVLAIEPKGAANVIVVDVSTKALKNRFIYVSRSWLEHAHA